MRRDEGRDAADGQPADVAIIAGSSIAPQDFALATEFKFNRAGLSEE